MALKSLKSPGAAFEGLWTAKPSAAACEGVPPALPWCPTQAVSKSLKSPAAAFEGLEPQNPPPWYLPRPHKLFLLGFETAFDVARSLSWYLPKPHKLPKTATWHVLGSLKSPAAAFEGLWTAKPSAAACEGVPLALPWYLPRPHKLFLLGFETATWHVLGTP